MLCSCPSTQLEAYAVWHDLSESEQWRRYSLAGKARTTPGEIHHLGCPFHRTAEQLSAERLQAFREELRAKGHQLSDDLPGSY
jgi:hypothetical protein